MEKADVAKPTCTGVAPNERRCSGIVEIANPSPIICANTVSEIGRTVLGSLSSLGAAARGEAIGDRRLAGEANAARGDRGGCAKRAAAVVDRSADATRHRRPRLAITTHGTPQEIQSYSTLDALYLK